MNKHDAFLIIEKNGDELHLVADIYWHDVHGSWTSEEPCGYYFTLEEFEEVDGNVWDLEGYDSRKLYVQDDLELSIVEEEWNSCFHVHTLEELKMAQDGTYIWEYKI